MIESRDLKPGARLRHSGGGTVVIERRKEDDSGWWNTDGSGLDDGALARTKDWSVEYVPTKPTRRYTPIGAVTYNVSTGRNIGQQVSPLFSCSECGAAVADTTAHTGWHDGGEVSA